jgi:tripartite-type tricarboxylate transporter receptor subunit TctC
LAIETPLFVNFDFPSMIERLLFALLLFGAALAAKFKFNSSVVWPYKKTTLVSNFVPGGAVYSLLALQLKYMGPLANISVISGDGGINAYRFVKTMPNDGSTFSAVTIPDLFSVPMVNSTFANFSYSDMEVAYIYAFSPGALAVYDNTVETFDDFLNLARVNSSLAVVGVGMYAANHFTALNIMRFFNVKFRYISVESGAKAISKVVSGQAIAFAATVSSITGSVYRDKFSFLIMASQYVDPLCKCSITVL